MYAVRLALILEMLQYACGHDDLREIGVTAMRGALQLVEYFKRGAVKVHEVIYNNGSPVLNYPVPKQELYNELPQTFTTETGLIIALRHNIPERTFKRFLTNRELFRYIDHGEYEKCA